MKELLKIAPMLQSAELVKDTAKTSKKKNLKIDDMLHSATKVLVGSSLIKAENKLIDGL